MLLQLTEKQKKEVDHFFENVVLPHYKSKKIFKLNNTINEINRLKQHLNNYPFPEANSTLAEIYRSLDDKLKITSDDLEYLKSIEDNEVELEGNTYYQVGFCGIGESILYVWEWDEEKLTLDITDYSNW